MQSRKSHSTKINSSRILGYIYIAFLLSTIIIFIYYLVSPRFINNEIIEISPLITIAKNNEVPAKVSVQNGCGTRGIASKYKAYFNKFYNTNFDCVESINTPDGRKYKKTTIYYKEEYQNKATMLGKEILNINPEDIRVGEVDFDIALILGGDYVSLDSYNKIAQSDIFQP